MSAKGYTVAAKIFDYFQVMVFTGVFLWLILENKNAFVAKSFLLLSVVGGFTFLLFWETKSQYTITYFILLFPYAATGYELLLEKGTNFIKETSKPILIYSTLAVALFLVGYVKDASHCLSSNNEAYNIFVENWNDPHLDESVYEINHMRAQLPADQERIADYIKRLEAEQERRAYYEGLLNENGIEY